LRCSAIVSSSRRSSRPLDDDRHRLLDRLKLQEGATMRVEEQMAALEQYLGRPDEGYKSLAYYQLKSLWRVACKRLEQFGAELGPAAEGSRTQEPAADFERARRDRVALVDRELVEARVLGEQFAGRQKLARQRLASLKGFWNYFRHRTLSDAIQTRDSRHRRGHGPDRGNSLAQVQSIQSEAATAVRGPERGRPARREYRRHGVTPS
jgi:hypothetical protein